MLKLQHPLLTKATIDIQQVTGITVLIRRAK